VSGGHENTVKTHKIDGLNFHLKEWPRLGTTKLSRAFPAERGHRGGRLRHLAYLIGYFKQNKGAKNCVVFSGTAFNGFFEKYVAAKFFHSWDPKILAKRLDDVKHQYLSLSPEKKKNHHTIFVLDDLVGTANWKSSIIQHLFTSHRHYDITILVSLQYPNSISPLI